MKQTSMILMSDYYKQAHAEQYPQGISKLISYATARMTRVPKEMYGDKLTVFGIQAYIKDFLIERFNETFFNVPLEEAMQEYRDIIGDTFPIQYVNTGKFEALHKLGYLPVEICALPEGCRVPIRSAFELPEGQCQVPFMSIVNTHPDFPWITEFLESVTSSEIWYPMAVANQAYYYRQIANEWYEKTGCGSARSAISEFGYRGGKSSDASIKASAAFLTSFNKTATIPAIKYVRDYYGDEVKDIGSGMISTEHSVMCSNFAVDSNIDCIDFTLGNPEENLEKLGDVTVGDIIKNNSGLYICIGVLDGAKMKLGDIQISNGVTTWYFKEYKDTEAVFLKKLFSELYPTGNVSVVMDTYDYWANLKRCGKGKNNVFESLEEVYNYIKSKGQGRVDYSNTDDVSTVICNVRNKDKIINVKMSYISAGSYGTNDLSVYIKDGYNKYESLETMLNNYENGENCYCFINKFTIVIINFNNYANFELYDIIMNREGTVFFRGDSGDPVDIICGKELSILTMPSMCVLEHSKCIKSIYDYFYIEDENKYYTCESINGKVKFTPVDSVETSAEHKGTVELLWDMFGGTVNEAGYKVLDSHVRAIYGDSITPSRAKEIYSRLADKGFAACNVALGAGSFSMQCTETEDGRLLPFTRDTYGIAIKATWCQHSNGEEYQLFKNPKTDTGKFKKSQKGLIYVTEDEKGEIIAEDGYTSKTIPKYNMLQPIFRDGKMLKETTLKEIRERLDNSRR